MGHPVQVSLEDAYTSSRLSQVDSWKEWVSRGNLLTANEGTVEELRPFVIQNNYLRLELTTSYSERC
jgi:hypothetical protein